MEEKIVLTPEEIESELAQCIGTEERYKTMFPGFCYTDGIQQMAVLCNAYWLVQDISAYQIHKKVLYDRALREFQIWELKVKNGRGTLTVSRDTDDVVFTKRFSTDFSLSYIKIYVENKTMCLPVER